MSDKMNRNDRENLIRGIMQRTSGSPCGRARDLICEQTDGTLEKVDAGLLSAHSEHCADCRSLAATMAWMRRPLQELAEIDPGPQFTADVLQQTLPLGQRLVRRLRRFGIEWAELMRRPRIAWEAAYVGAAIIGLLFAAPISPLNQVPGQALRVAQANPVQALAQVSREVVPEAVVTWTDTAWSATGGRARVAARTWRDDLWDRLGRAWDAGRPLGSDVGDLGTALWDSRGEDTRLAIAEVRNDFSSIWNELTTAHDRDSSNQQQDSSGDGT
jgi:hypothetical protein